MTDQDLIGEKVVSPIYGEGRIESIDGEKLQIIFDRSSEVKKFTFSAFLPEKVSKPMRAQREEVQEYIRNRLTVSVEYEFGAFSEEDEPSHTDRVIRDTEITLRDAPKAQNGYYFLGWQNALGELMKAGSKFVVKTDVRIHASWKQIAVPVRSNRRLFYVFQGKTFEKELSEGFIFAPYSKNRTFHYWERMSEVRTGDIILHGAMGSIVAISEAQGSEYKIRMPNFAREWENYGPYARRIDINVCYPLFPIDTSAYRDMIIELCRNEKYAPFNKIGGGNQGYLYDLPKKLGAFFIRLLIARNAELKDVPFIQDILRQMKDDNEYHYEIKSYI